MTVEEILAALKALVDQASATGEPMPEADVARYEELEGLLAAKQKTTELIKRQAARVTTNVQAVEVDDHQADVQRAFRQFLVTGRPDTSLIARAQSEGTGSAGGFLVPDSFRGKMVERLKAFGGLMNAAESFSTSTGAPVYWLTNDDVLSTEAGIVDENAQNSFGADFVFGRNTLNAYKYDTAGATGDWLKVSWELAQDSDFDLESFIARKFAERIQRKLAVDLVTGSGVNEPVGITSTMGGIPSSGVTIASATAGPTYAELVTIEHSVDPAYRDNASWLMNDKTLSLIEQLVDLNGRPLIWNSGAALGDSKAQKSLLGYPVVIDQAMPDLLTGSTKGLIFGDLNRAYVVRSVKDFTLVTAHELFARNGQIGYMGWARYDGMVQDANAAVYVTSHA